MTNQEVVDKCNETMESSPVKALSVNNVNHKPHPYVIGPKHNEYATEHSGGMLTEDVCRAVQCAHPKCNLPYDEHISDKVLFVQLKMDAENAEVVKALQSIRPIVEENGIVGYAFVETKEKYRVK